MTELSSKRGPRLRTKQAFGRRGLATTIAAASLLLAAGTAGAQTKAPKPAAEAASGSGAADARASLKAPPAVDYAKLCKPAAPAQPLAFDWPAWKGEETGVDPLAMLADAQRYVEGDREVARNKPLARSMLEVLARGADAASPRAKRDLGVLLLDRDAGAVDPARAERLLAEALAERETTAAISLGRFHRDGRLPHASPEAAQRFLGIAAGLGDPRAALEFAALVEASGEDQPFAGAAEHYATLALIGAQTAIQTGDCAIVANVGDFLLGPDGTKDPAGAAKWYAVGDRIGDPLSEMKLARLTADGTGVERNEKRAAALFDEAAAHGSIDAMTIVADRLLSHGGDMKRGLKLLDTAVANRSMSALRLLSRYQAGDFTGIPDFPAMTATLDRAIAMPGVSAFILADRAKAFLDGRGGPVDEAKAADLFRTVAAEGSADADVEYAAYLLRTGGDLPEAVRRLESAAAQGNPAAMMDLSETLRCEAGPALGEAATWRDRAAAAGNVAALRRLGLIAADLGRSEDARRALQAAADAGDRLAMVELAKLETAPEAVESLVGKAGALGQDVVEGRLALSRSYLQNEIAGGEEAARKLLATIDASSNAGADFEIAKLQLASAKSDSPEWSEAIARMRRAAFAGNGRAMIAMAGLGEAATPETGVRPADWTLRAARLGEPQALATLVADTEPARNALSALEKRRVCDPLALLQIARLYRQSSDKAAAARADRMVERARSVASERTRDLFAVGEAFASGLATGTSDPSAAIDFLGRAAERGHLRAAVSLAGVLAHAGDGASRYPEALNWLRKAALGGEPRAIRTLASFADERAGQKKEFGLTMTTLKDMADAGNVAAVFAYGSILTTSDGASRTEGVAYLERAASAGHVDAMKTLARLHASGLVGDASADESTKWTRQAAERGDAEAMFRYALALDLGFGVKMNHEAAVAWHEKARSHGFVN